MNDYHDQADAIQEKLRQAMQTGNKQLIQQLSKQRDDLDAHVKTHGMMPEDARPPVAPDPQNYDSDVDYYNDRDADPTPPDTDSDYENMDDAESDDWFDESKEKIGNMDADAFDAALSRMKKLAGQGPLRTVYDPARRVYKNVPHAVQPAQQPKKMKIKELLEGVRKSPGQYGGGGPSMSAQRMTAPMVSTVDRTAPWVKAAIGKARKKSQDFNALPTDKEKFDFIYKLQSTSTLIRILSPGRNPYHIQSYDPATGDISLLLKTPKGNEIVTGNTNNFTYQGRQVTPSTGGKTYIFQPGKVTSVSTEPRQAVPGRPVGPVKKKYNFPTMPW
jgi:hypothetical protein